MRLQPSGANVRVAAEGHLDESVHNQEEHHSTDAEETQTALADHFFLGVGRPGRTGAAGLRIAAGLLDRPPKRRRSDCQDVRSGGAPCPEVIRRPGKRDRSPFKGQADGGDFRCFPKSGRMDGERVPTAPGNTAGNGFADGGGGRTARGRGPQGACRATPLVSRIVISTVNTAPAGMTPGTPRAP